MDLLQQNLAVSIIVTLALIGVNLLILWFIIYTAVRSAVRDDRLKAARERHR
ncbi:hypothetical protein [Microbacterium sp. gxy059]|uniref:hypothetical protein n=1 Tax=Microbacterium sp. gxy059 TaxID=2957199 RepID=UPI003D99974B